MVNIFRDYQEVVNEKDQIIQKYHEALQVSQARTRELEDKYEPKAVKNVSQPTQ